MDHAGYRQNNFGPVNGNRRWDIPLGIDEQVHRCVSLECQAEGFIHACVSRSRRWMRHLRLALESSCK